MNTLSRENANELLMGDMLIRRDGEKYLVHKVEYVERYGGYHLTLIAKHSENGMLFSFEDACSKFYGCEMMHTKYSQMYKLYDTLCDIRKSMDELNDMLSSGFHAKTENGLDYKWFDDAFFNKEDVANIISKYFEKSLDAECYNMIDFAEVLKDKLAREIPFETEQFNEWN